MSASVSLSFITCPRRYVTGLVNIRETVNYHRRASCIMTKLVLGSTYTLLRYVNDKV